MSTEPVRHKFRVEEFLRMVEVGILDETARVELIDGEVVEMTPTGHRHESHSMRWTMLYAPRLVGRAIVAVHCSIGLGEYGMPQPDMMILKHREDYYASPRATAADVLLLVEISDSSLWYDRDTKLRLYAAHGICEYWIVNLVDRVIEMHRAPGRKGYAAITRHVAGGTIAPLALPELQLAVSELLSGESPT